VRRRGTGKRLFGDTSDKKMLRLADSKTGRRRRRHPLACPVICVRALALDVDVSRR